MGSLSRGILLLPLIAASSIAREFQISVKENSRLARNCGRFAVAESEVVVGVLDASDKRRCSGTLLSPTHVLTAARCLFEDSPEFFRRCEGGLAGPLKAFRLRGLRIRLTNTTTATVAKAVAHPLWCSKERGVHGVDLAIIHLAHRLPSTHQFACLSRSKGEIPASLRLPQFSIDPVRGVVSAGPFKRHSTPKLSEDTTLYGRSVSGEILTETQGEAPCSSDAGAGMLSLDTYFQRVAAFGVISHAPGCEAVKTARQRQPHLSHATDIRFHRQWLCTESGLCELGALRRFRSQPQELASLEADGIPVKQRRASFKTALDENGDRFHTDNLHASKSAEKPRGRLSAEENSALVMECGRREAASHRKSSHFKLACVGGKAECDREKIQNSPWSVFIHSRGDPAKGHHPQVCTGNLVSSRHVLTAAHCFFNLRGSRDFAGDCDEGKAAPFVYPFPPKGPVFVELGRGDMRKDSEQSSGGPKRVRIDVVRVTLHPDWCRKGVGYEGTDLALMELASPIPSDVAGEGRAWPVCLASPEQDLPDKLRVTGFGFNAYSVISHEKPQGLLLSTDLVVKQEESSGKRSFRTATVESDTCVGDSGAGLVKRGEARQLLFGIVSLGFPCDELQNPKDDIGSAERRSSFALHTDVRDHRLWICHVSGVCPKDLTKEKATETAKTTWPKRHRNKFRFKAALDDDTDWEEVDGQGEGVEEEVAAEEEVKQQYFQEPPRSGVDKNPWQLLVTGAPLNFRFRPDEDFRIN